MKNIEQFVGNILQAVRDSHGKGPAATTELIQQALRTAGLLPQQHHQAQAQPQAFVDLNAAPEWAAPKAGPQPQPQPQPQAMPGAGKLAEWAERLKALRPGQAPLRQPWSDPRAPGEFVSGVFTIDAGSRDYRLYVPSTPAAGPRPLIVMLHGCKQDPDDFAAGTAMNVLAEQHGCLVLYPGQASRANGSNCWNWFDAGHQHHGHGEPAIIAGMTREILREHGADPDRVFIAGLSAGGAMAAVMAAAYPELYSAVGVHSGLPVGCAHDLMSGLNAMKGASKKGGKRPGRAAPHAMRPRTIVFHGDRDAVVHPSNGEAVFRQSMHGADGREEREEGKGYTRTRTLDAAGRPQAEYWVLHGAGHAWAGGSPQGSYTDPSGPDASEAMLRFFLAQG